jgi:hypothetical protein
MMQTNESGRPQVKPSGADSMRRLVPPNAFRQRRNEPLLRELLAEAHARIRALEEALDRVKNAV